MKRSRAPSQVASQTTVTTTTKKARAPNVPRSPFGAPKWAGKPKTGFPKQLRMKHRYVEYVTLTSTTGAIGSYSFRANGMFDPNYTSTGHQPLYFDQVAAIYNHFTVLTSKINVKIVVPTSVTIPLNCAMITNDDGTVTPAGIASQAEQPSAKFGVVIPGGNGQLVLSSKWSATEAFGPGALSDPNLQGSSSSDPSEQQLWSIQVGSADLAATITAYLQVTIEYDAIWQELKDIAGS